jgi:hypothetical protein
MCAVRSRIKENAGRGVLDDGAPMQRNPVTGEHFDEESIERPAQALVREAIQNSLDARANGGSSKGPPRP